MTSLHNALIFVFLGKSSNIWNARHCINHPGLKQITPNPKLNEKANHYLESGFIPHTYIYIYIYVVCINTCTMTCAEILCNSSPVAKTSVKSDCDISELPHGTVRTSVPLATWWSQICWVRNKFMGTVSTRSFLATGSQLNENLSYMEKNIWTDLAQGDLITSESLMQDKEIDGHVFYYVVCLNQHKPTLSCVFPLSKANP